MTFFLYILFSQSTDRYYVGHSEDPNRRLSEHNFGEYHKSTTPGRPWELKAVFSIQGTRGEAMKVEAYIKKQKSRKLIERLIDPEFTPSGALVMLVRIP
jgi:putative endonuclease